MGLWLYPAKQMFLGVYWNQPVCPSVCAQNTSFCESAGRGITSHLVIILVIFGIILTLYLTIQTFNDPILEGFGKPMRKGEKAGNQRFLLFPPCFLAFLKQISIFQSHFIFSSGNAFNLDQFKILSFGKELRKYLQKEINFLIGTVGLVKEV